MPMSGCRPLDGKLHGLALWRARMDVGAHHCAVGVVGGWTDQIPASDRLNWTDRGRNWSHGARCSLPRDGCGVGPPELTWPLARLRHQRPCMPLSALAHAD